jgi:hypothetical protein
LYFARNLSLLALVALAGCGGSSAAESGSSSNDNKNSANVSVSNGPSLKVVGNGGKCSLGSGATFHFVGSGFTPHSKVLLLVFAPPSYKDPVYKNPDRLYWYQANLGVYHADSHGRFHTIGWDCSHGPGNKPDVLGKSEVKALDWGTSVASSSAHFEVVP